MKKRWVDRQLDIGRLLEKRSFFLLGPRQTGKTTLIQHVLPDIRFYDLLDSANYLTLSRAYSDAIRHLIPIDSATRFRRKPPPDSDRFRHPPTGAW